MRAFVMTRGTERRMDYAFLGQSPPRRWWDGIGTWLLLEAEELVLSRRDETTTGLLLSGIPSDRCDVIGTRIRYTVVVDDAHEDPALAAWLVRCGLEEGERVRLGRALDAEFEADRVDAWLRRAEEAADGGGGGSAREIEGRLLAALRGGAGEGAAGRGPAGDSTPAADETWRASWVGGVQDPVARREFQARARRLIREARPGTAFTTHALGSVSGARRAAQALRDEVAVLLHDGGPDGIRSLSEAPIRGPVSAGKAPAPAACRGRGDRRGAMLVTVVAVLGLAVVLAILWLTG